MQRVRIKRMRENAVLPEYGSDGAAGMDFRACETVTIDPHGVAKIPLGWAAVVRNESNSDATISEGYKIAQGVLMPVYRATLVETDDLSETVRGASGFGSTGV